MNKTVKALGSLVAASALVFTASCSSADDEQPQADAPQWDLSAAPTQARWSNLNGLQVPSAKEGPEDTKPVRHGYNESPQGAVLAAINGQAQLAVTGDSAWPDVSRQVLAPGKGRDQWAQGRALASIKGSVPADQAAKFKGFKVKDFDKERTTVVLAVEYPKVGLVATPVQLTWLSNDWRIVLPPQDQTVESINIDSLDGFTEFSAKG